MKKALIKKLLLSGETIFGLILALVIVVSVFPLIPPFKNYYHSRTVLTGSMEPKIPKGSVVINQWVDQKNLKVGDVITYQRPSDKKIIYITHRIVKIDKTGLLWRFEAKGDVNPASDFGLVTQAGIEGKVILMIPLIGYLIELFKTPLGFLLLVALPLLVFIIRQIKDVLRLWPKQSIRKRLPIILLGFSFLAVRVSFVTYASFTSTQATITNITLSTAASFPVDLTPPMTTLSFSGKSINEKVLNGGFESGLTNWQTDGKVNITAADVFATPHNGTKMVRIGHTIDDGSEIWENKLTQQIHPGAKNLSFYYNFFSYDSINDNPGMVVRLNDYNVFYLSAVDIDNFDSPNSSGWTQLSFDISQIPDPVLEIIFYSGNTDNEIDQSWVYIDDVSTSEAVANNDSFTLIANEPAETYYSLDGGSSWLSGNSFNLSTITGTVDLLYYSVDTAGNIEGINTRRLVKDTQKPDAIDDLFAYATSKQTVNLSWTSPSDPPNASSSAVYDIRYSLTPILDDTDFSVATAVLNPPAPRRPGELQSFEVSGLDSDTLYYFAIKSADAALNWSNISNTDTNFDTTLDPSDPLGDPDINPGDVVINELMWMGTSGSTADEYLELRNMTDQDIDLSGWQITKWVSGTSEELMLTIPSGKIIPAHGYFLIANFDKLTSKINIEPDLIDNSLILVNNNLQIKLYNGDWEDPGNQIIDTADNGEGAPATGQYDAGSNVYYSMERDNTPGDGTQASSWHTIFDDSALMHSYWDVDTVEKGTPGAANLSQSGPMITQLIIQPELTFEPIVVTESASPSASIISLPEIATESAVGPTPEPSPEPSLPPDLPIQEPIIIEEILNETAE